MEQEKRGGRRDVYKESDEAKRKFATEHINRFPRVESHYCRKNSTREYPPWDLTKRKMYTMYQDAVPNPDEQACYETYKRIMKEKNLSFHRPKKDRCGLCLLYEKADECKKKELKVRAAYHREGQCRSF